MATRRKQDRDGSADIVERGGIFFIYRPKVQHEEADDFGDVERFHVVLKPEGRAFFRSLVIGRKRLPDIGSHERNWGFVDAVAKSGKELESGFRAESYETKTRGERDRPAARPAGEGVYALVRQGRDLHLIYALELPERPGAVQKAFNIDREGSFAVSVKNPEKGSPPGTGLSENEEADLPRAVQKSFRGRKFETEDLRPLDHEGVEFLLIGARKDPERETGVGLTPEHEDLDAAEIVRQLRFKPPEHPPEPLLSGKWR